MTCMVVCFPGAPRPCEEAISREIALDAVLSHRVAGEQVKWPGGGVVGKYGPSSHLLLRAVCLCSGSAMPKHGFQDPGLRGHPRLASWRRAPQQVSWGKVARDRVTGPGLLLRASLLLCRATVIAEAYSKLRQIPEECQEVRCSTLVSIPKVPYTPACLPVPLLVSLCVCVCMLQCIYVGLRHAAVREVRGIVSSLLPPCGARN